MLHPNNIHIFKWSWKMLLITNDYKLSVHYFENAIQIFLEYDFVPVYTYSKQSEYNKALKVLKNIDNKTSDKFNDVQLSYAKVSIKSKIIDINTESIDKEKYDKFNIEQ